MADDLKIPTEEVDLMDVGSFGEAQYLDFGSEDDKVSDNTIEDTQQQDTVDTTSDTDQVKTIDWFSDLNKSLGTNYGDVEELKSILGEYTNIKEKVSKMSDFDAISERLSKAEKERNLIAEKYRELRDPKSFFADDVEFKRNQMLKSNPNVNGEVARKAITIDLESADPLDIIALNMQLTHTRLSGGEIGAKEAFLASKGIDVSFDENGKIDSSELSRAQMNIINLEAERAAKEIEQIRGAIPNVEPSKEIDDLINEWTASSQEPEFDASKWNGKIEDVVSSVDLFEVKDGDSVLYSEPIDKEFKDGLRDAVMDVIKKGKLEPTPETIKLLAEEGIKEYFFENKTEIAKRMKSHIERQIKEEQHRSVHNDTDPDKGGSKNAQSTRGYTTPLNKILGIG